METGFIGDFIEKYEFYIKVPITMFIVLTPLAVVPIFLGMTPDSSPKERMVIMRTTCWVATAVLLFFAITGELIFKFMGVDILSFQIAGGTLLFYIGFDMLRAKESEAKISKEERTAAMLKNDIAITPMAIPLISGPGTITFIIMQETEATKLAETLTIYGSIFLNMFVIYWIFYFCSHGAQWLNPFVLKVVRRITGLLLTSMAIQFILTALVKLNVIADFTAN